jgi:curved DNA binding protein
MSSLAAVNSDSDGEEVMDLSNSAILDKYKAAAEIVNKALEGVVTTQIKDGASVRAICSFGNAVIKQCADNTYKKGKVEKGIAFPTCISVNHCVCHFSPLEDEDVTIKTGDVVKIDMGAHISGCVAVVGHTLVVGGGVPDGGETKASEGEKATASFSDVATAAYKAGQLCLSLMVPGNTNTMLTETIAKVAEAYGVTPCQGVLMHQMKPFVIDGNKVVINKVEPDQNVEECTFVSEFIFLK